MYQVKIDGGYLYYPADKEYTAYNLKLEQELNEAGSLQFDLPNINPHYDDISVRQSRIAVYKDDEAIFYGEIREAEEGIYCQKHVYAVGELAFLHDSIQPQKRYQCSPLEMFTALINEHNSQVEYGKQFKIGMVTVTDKNDYIYRYTNYEDTLSVLREDLCGPLDGYLRIRHVDGMRYLDLVTLADYGKFSTQEIRFGDNILEYANNVTADKIATAVVPLGAKLEESAVEGLDAYTTIESVNDGKNYVYNQSAVDRFGWVKVVKRWEDVTEPANLKAKAEEWLTSVQYAEMSFELTALDLSMLDTSVQSYEIGDRVSVICDSFGVNTVVPVQRKETMLDDLSQNRITLGNTVTQSFSTQNLNRAAEIERRLPQESSILQAAKDNATAMLTGVNGGYVLFGINDSGQICEIFITDHPDKEKAQKIWRFNMNGLGYSSTGIDGPYGLAMTSDGAIVADFITTGTLNATLIKAGILTDEKGNFYLNMDTGVLKASFSELSISGSAVATQSYASGAASSALSSAKTYADSAASTAASSAVNSQTQEFIFNKLTNNGTTQGIYLSDGKLYINASYIKTGKFSADYISGGTISGSAFKSSKSNGSYVQISGGALTVMTKKGDDYLKLREVNNSSRYINAGGDVWGCKRDSKFAEAHMVDVLADHDINSDIRIKKDIIDLNRETAREFVLNAVLHEFTSEKNPDHRMFGVIAQELKKQYEKLGIDEKRFFLLRKMDNGFYRVEYKEYIPLIMSVIQDQQKQIEQLQKEVEDGRH